MGQNSNYAWFYYIVVLPIIFICIFAFYMNVIHPFTEEKKYIKSEMRRSYGDEYYYWKRELRNLYIENIPVFGWIIRRFKR